MELNYGTFQRASALYRVQSPDYFSVSSRRHMEKADSSYVSDKPGKNPRKVHSPDYFSVSSRRHMEKADSSYISDKPGKNPPK
uniref:TEX36 n=1 Tax=Steinernema glaseri TaxID=37863 RepID=A0A1I8A4R4_9BILA